MARRVQRGQPQIGVRRKVARALQRVRSALRPAEDSSGDSSGALAPAPAPACRVVLVLFNTLAREGRFWGNMQLSLVSGEIKRLGIDNDLMVLLMRPGESARNRRTVEEFVEQMNRWRPAHIVLWANWLPWLPDRLRRECGARVMTLDRADPGDVAEQLADMDPHASTVATVAGARTPAEAARILEQPGPLGHFAPNFDYQFVGVDEPLTQTLAFVSLLSCPFDASIDANPRYADVDLPPESSRFGCSYCNAAREQLVMDDAGKERNLAHQIRYLQQHLPDLEEIAVPFPEDYLLPLAAVLRRADEHGIRPVVISGQFNSVSLAGRGDDLDQLLTAAEDAGFEFHVNVVGLESFDEDDLELYNRGDLGAVKDALAVMRRLRLEHDPARFMPATVGSLILFHPWQTVEGLRRNIDAMRREGLEGIFTSINVNDMRFHPGVPMYHLAKRDGLLTPVDTSEVQEVPLGGYFAEEPWRFANLRTEAIHRLFVHLDGRTQQRLGLLDACVRAVEDEPDGEIVPRRVSLALDRMAGQVARDALPAAGPHALLRVGSSTNVGYERDLWGGCRYSDALSDALLQAERLECQADGRVTIAGPEPTMLDWLPELIVELKRRGAGEVELLTYGRMLAYPRYLAQLVAAGTDLVTVLLHAPAATQHDEAVRVPGAFDQALTGLRQVARLGSGGARIRAAITPVIGPECEGQLPRLLSLARDIGVSELRLAVPLANLPLDRVDGVAAECEELVFDARRDGVEAGYDPELSLVWLPAAGDGSGARGPAV